MRVIIDPADDILYKSFYIHGLERLYGTDRICYLEDPFRDLSKESRNSKSMRFVVQNGLEEKRYMISCNDSYQIIPELYDWCDVYGSVNANFAKTDQLFHGKLVSLCPSFAVKCWSFPKSIRIGLLTVNQRGGSIKKHFGKYRRLQQRQSYSQYSDSKTLVKGDYIFHLSTKWRSDEWNKNDEGVNLSRAYFIRSCKSLHGVRFEGGMLFSKLDTNVDPFLDCEGVKMPSEQWLRKTQESAIVFNTPAYWQCHGWKLGEYMALGKAIISTPLSNDLPVPLSKVCKNGGIHFVENNYDSISDGVRFMMEHKQYCKSLSEEISGYWQKYGTPIASLRLLGINK